MLLKWVAAGIIFGLADGFVFDADNSLVLSADNGGKKTHFGYSIGKNYQNLAAVALLVAFFCVRVNVLSLFDLGLGVL